MVPTRDRLPLLVQTLHTVLAQDVDDLEVVVVDDASQDDTAAWLAAHPDPRVRTTRHTTPQGVSGARNTGAAMARAPWLAFVDDDDLWSPAKLSAQLAAAVAEDAGWAFSGALTILSGPRLLAHRPGDPNAVRWLPWRNTVPGGGSNVIVHREVLDAVGGFNPSASIVADWDMWIRLLEVGPPAVVEAPLVAYRMHATNMSGDVPRMLAGIGVIDERYAQLRGGQSVDWSAVYRWLGMNAMIAGDHRRARSLARQALRAAHPGARRRLLRAMLPVRPRLPVADPTEAADWLSRLRGRRVVPWPDGARTWVSQALQVTVGVADHGSVASSATRP